MILRRCTMCMLHRQQLTSLAPQNRKLLYIGLVESRLPKCTWILRHIGAKPATIQWDAATATTTWICQLPSGIIKQYKTLINQPELHIIIYIFYDYCCIYLNRCSALCLLFNLMNLINPLNMELLINQII